MHRPIASLRAVSVELVRVALGWLLFGKGDRHITAEKLYEEATGARVFVKTADDALADGTLDDAKVRALIQDAVNDLSKLEAVISDIKAGKTPTSTAAP